MRMRRFIFVGWIVVACIPAGCSRGPETPPTAPVHGRVTFQGKPVEGAQVAFFCQQQGGRPGIGNTDADGRYRLSTFGVNDGALIGHHSVTISKFLMPRNAAQSGQEASARQRTFLPPGGARNLLRDGTSYALPWRYSDVKQSGLSADVTPDGSEINFDLSE